MRGDKSVCVRGERNRVGGRRECICEKVSERRVCVVKIMVLL